MISHKSDNLLIGLYNHHIVDQSYLLHYVFYNNEDRKINHWDDNYFLTILYLLILFFHIYLKQLQNGMSSSGYVTRFYRNYLFGYKPHVTKYFWLKEFLYSLKDLVQGIFVKPTIVGMKRNLDFTLYLVRERSRYNENVKKVLGICENLEESRRTSLLK